MVELLMNMDHGAYYFFRHTADNHRTLDTVLQLPYWWDGAIAAGLMAVLATGLLLFGCWGLQHRTLPRIRAIVFSALYVGVVAICPIGLALHYVSDVIAGMCGGLAMALVAPCFYASPPAGIARNGFSPGN